MKVSKEYYDRRNQILDVSEKLFAIKGYDKCTINSILNEVGIAKGTFYYYFKSKEDVLDAIIERVTDIVVERVENIVSNNELPPSLKLLNAFLSMRVENEVNDEFMEELHNPQNALMHQKSLNVMVTRLSPLLSLIVKDGINQGMFKSDFPSQYMKIILASSITLLDDGIFQIEKEEQQMTFRALIAVLEKMLGVPNESFWNLTMKYWK